MDLMISNRLLCVAKMVDNANLLVDVGCDHAFLSIYLIKNNLCKKIINIDNKSLPLENGKKNVEKYNLKSNIEFILNNGLNNLKITEKIDYISICGIGASNIVNIIKNNLNNPKYYICQTSVDPFLIRKYLKQNNYFLVDEQIIYENKKYYETLKFSKLNKTNIKDDFDIYIGPIIKLQNNNLILKQYLINKYHYINSLNINKINDELKQEFKIIQQYLKQQNWI